MNDDMKSVIVPKSDQLNADDLISGPITIKVTGVSIKSGEQPISINYDGDGGKPYKACKSMCRILVSAWGADSKQYAGRSMTLYRDPTVKWGGMDVGGIRISHLSDIDTAMTMALTMTRSNRKPFTVKPLTTASASPQTAAPATASAVSPSAPPSAGDADPDEEPSIGDEQEAHVLQLLKENAVDLKAVLEFGGWTNLRRDMPARLFNSVCGWIRDDRGIRTKPKVRV